MTPARARTVHLVVAAVAWGAVVFQLALVLTGSAVLVEEDPPGRAESIYRFFAYFTIQSNLLVAIASTVLARDPEADRPWWRVVRVASLVGITVTGVVHFFLLRPLLDLDGADWLADKLLHVVVPLLAVIGWVAFGPRGKAERRLLLASLAYPVGWLVYTLVRGAVTGWYPYPFLDVGLHGYGGALAACAGVAVLFVAMTWGFDAADGRLPRRRG